MRFSFEIQQVKVFGNKSCGQISDQSVKNHGFLEELNENGVQLFDTKLNIFCHHVALSTF